MPHDIRRRPAEKKLDQIGREGINYDNLFSNILEEYPTWRGDNNSTVHATVMAANDGYMFTKMYDHRAYRGLDSAMQGKSDSKQDL